MTETFELIKRAQEGDKEALDILVKENLGLVYAIVKRMYVSGCELEDLVQIGTIGLMKAIERFDCTYEVKFSTYAVPLITGEVKRYLRDDGMLKISRSIKENGIKVKKAQAALFSKLGREATIAELSEETKIAGEDIVIAIDAMNEIDSIDRTIMQADGSDVPLSEKLSREDYEQEEMINKMFVGKLMEGLNEHERKLIYLRYYENATQTQVAKQLGMTQVQVSRLEKKLLLRMRYEAGELYNMR